MISSSYTDNVSSCNSSFIDFDPVSEDEVRKTILIESPPKSCSLDPITTTLLKECINELVPFITKLVNQSLTTGIVPKAFKISHVGPVLKKPSLDRNELKNYRQIAILLFAAKVMERIVSNQLRLYLEENCLFLRAQSAYRRFHSTRDCTA